MENLFTPAEVSVDVTVHEHHFKVSWQNILEVLEKEPELAVGKLTHAIVVVFFLPVAPPHSHPSIVQSDHKNPTNYPKDFVGAVNDSDYFFVIFSFAS